MQWLAYLEHIYSLRHLGLHVCQNILVARRKNEAHEEALESRPALQLCCPLLKLIDRAGLYVSSGEPDDMCPEPTSTAYPHVL